MRCSPRCRIRTTCRSPSSASQWEHVGGGVGPGRLQRLPRLPVRALHRPRNDVLQPAEHRPAVTGMLGQPEAVRGLDGVSAPRAPLIGAGHCDRTLLGGRLPGDARPAPDYRARGGPDGPGAARTGPQGSGPGRLRRPARVRALRPVSRESPPDRQRGRAGGRAGDARGRVTGSRPPPSRPRAPTTSGARTRSCARRSTAG